jgi:hypothetical protein
MESSVTHLLNRVNKREIYFTQSQKDKDFLLEIEPKTTEEKDEEKEDKL